MFDSTPGCEVVDVVSARDDAGVANLCDRDDLDLLAVHSPPFLHAPHVRRGIAGGHAVLCDKPFGVDLLTAFEGQVEGGMQTVIDGGARIFVAGHSQGGVYALHYGSTHAVDGVIAIAPGGNVGSPAYRKEVGASVAQARSLVADGKD